MASFAWLISCGWHLMDCLGCPLFDRPKIPITFHYVSVDKAGDISALRFHNGNLWIYRSQCWRLDESRAVNYLDLLPAHAVLDSKPFQLLFHKQRKNGPVWICFELKFMRWLGDKEASSMVEDEFDKMLEDVLDKMLEDGLDKILQ